MTSYLHQAPSTKHQAPSTKHQYFTIFHRLTFAILRAPIIAAKPTKTTVRAKTAFFHTFPLPESSAAVFGDVASQNVVGYVQTGATPTGTGKTMLTSAFQAVGSTGKKFKLSNLKVDSNGAACAGRFILQTLKSSGKTDKSYYWWYNKSHGMETGEAGWYNQAGTVQFKDETDVEFDVGQAFWTQGSGNKLVSSGEVLTDTVTVPTVTGTGKVQVGNPRPATVNITSVTVDTAGAACAGRCIVQTLKSTGKTDKSYYWWYNKTHGIDSGTAGWYNAAGTVLVEDTDNVVLEPNTGWAVQGSGYTIVFPQFKLNN